MRWLDKREMPDIPLQRPKTGRWVRPFKLKWRDIFILHRRGPQGPEIGIDALEKRAVSREVAIGSLEERIIYRELVRRHIPFDFQSSLMGGRLELGGMVADFILLDRPLIIRVQGTIWHSGFVSEQKDEKQRGILEAYGFDVVDIWDWEVHDPGLTADWFRENIDMGIPVRGGGVVPGDRVEEDEVIRVG